MKQKEGFVLREICGEKVIVAEGLKVVDFGKMVSMNETATWLWEKCSELGDFTAEQLTWSHQRPSLMLPVSSTNGRN